MVGSGSPDDKKSELIIRTLILAKRVFLRLKS